MDWNDDTRYYSSTEWYHFEPWEILWFDADPSQYHPNALAAYHKEERERLAGLRSLAAGFTTGAISMILAVVVMGVSGCDQGVEAEKTLVNTTQHVFCDPDLVPCGSGEVCRWDWDHLRTRCVEAVDLGEWCNVEGPLVEQTVCASGECGYVLSLDEHRCLATEVWTPCTAEDAWICGPTMRCAGKYDAHPPDPGEAALCFPRECYTKKDCPDLPTETAYCADGLCIEITPCSTGAFQDDRL